MLATTANARFTRAAWGVLAWNIVVVLWGAYVRASGSGAGCGSHWPLCNGEVVPSAPRPDTVIEFAHRATSGIDVLATVALAVWSFFLFPRKHRVRRMATLGVVFLIFEALLGAGLVRFEYVAHNASVGRAFYLCLHLVNTQVLLGVLAMTAWFSRSSAEPLGALRPVVFATLPIAILISITGVIAALGDTLFPAASVQQDFSAGAHFLLRLRILHPALAILGASYFVFASVVVMRSNLRPIATRSASAAIVLSLAQLGAGAINLTLAAPIPMQIVHLFLADLVWLSLVLLTVETMAGRPERE
jgi:cytochrome c oxidase assembly protein subunit 15